MNPILKSHCETGNFSRGYLLVGDFENSRISARKASAIILNCAENLLDSHPDFMEQSYESFSSDDSRYLAQKISAMPILAPKQVLILKILSMVPEAAVSFAQIFEKSFSFFHFFLIAKLAEGVPVALRSRLVEILDEKGFELKEEREIFWRKFLKSGSMERLAFSKEAVNDKKIALDFLNELEVVLEIQMKKEKKSSTVFSKLVSSLDDLKSMRPFLSDRAPSPKMIIEHFCLTLPKF